MSAEVFYLGEEEYICEEMIECICKEMIEDMSQKPECFSLSAISFLVL